MYGPVIGQANPEFFNFSIADPEVRPSNYEYVQIEVEETVGDQKEKVTVLSQVKSLYSRHPFYDTRTSPEAVMKQQQLGAAEDLLQIVATAKILGYLHDAGGGREIRRPRAPPLPGAPVYRASDDLIMEFFRLPERELPLEMGYLLHRPGVRIPISGRELHRHTAILAMTRYGKSYFAGKVMEELLKKGATILAIDVHGDYINMVNRPNGVAHDFFSDKVTVYRPEGAEEMSLPYFKPLRFAVESCGFAELCTLAGIQGDLQMIVLRNALKEMRSEKQGTYGLEDVISRLEEGMEEEKAEERGRIFNVVRRLDDLKDRHIFSDYETPIEEFFKPMHLSDIFLSGLSSDVQDVLVGLILRKVFEAKFRKQPWARLPIFIFVEEAHRFAAPPDIGGGRFSRDILARIAAEGSKFGLFLTVVSQRPRRIDPDILSNCSNMAILRVVNRNDQGQIQAASESFSEDLLEDLPALDQGEVVLVGPFVSVPVMIRTLERETQHGGRTPDIYGLLQEAKSEAERDQMRKKSKIY